MQHGITHCGHHAACSQDIFYNWKCVPVDPLQPILPPTPHFPPLATTNLSFVSTKSFFKIPHIRDRTVFAIFVLVCLTSFTPHNTLMAHPCCHNAKSSSFLWLNRFRCTYTPHSLYQFIHRWTLRLFPDLGYWEQCCDGHGVQLALWQVISFAQAVFPEVGPLDHVAALLTLGCLRKLPTPFHSGCTPDTLTNRTQGSLFSTSSHTGYFLSF